MIDWKYKIFARHVSERSYYEVSIAVRSNQGKQIETLRQDFGLGWDIWIERFPREHPHAALQRRLNAHAIQAKRMANVGRRKANGELKLDDIKIRHDEREAVNLAISRAGSLKNESPARLPDATPQI